MVAMIGFSRLAGLVILGLSCVLAIGASPALAATPQVTAHTPHRAAGAAANLPYVASRTHHVNDVRFTITNQGVLGGISAGVPDQCGGVADASMEYPAHSGVEYLFGGALWVGAVKSNDTLVSVGWDGWQLVQELFPLPYPNGVISERTIRPVLKADSFSSCPDVLGSIDAVSDQDLIANYTDTVTAAGSVTPDPDDGRPHIPLQLGIEQRTFDWSTGVARRLFIGEFDIQNLGVAPLNSVYVGLFMDHDIGSLLRHSSYHEDDISGFVNAAPALRAPVVLDTINLAWTADNDGDPYAGAYDSASCTSAAGLCFLGAGRSYRTVSFNWWVSNVDTARDWGPNLQSTDVVFPKSNHGTPTGDKVKYAVMSNGEHDYDQIYTAVDRTAEGWQVPPTDPVYAAAVAGGADTRYLLSIGPYDLAPGSHIQIPIALVIGDGLHTDPAHFAATFDPNAPDAFRDGLDFSDLTRTAQLAQWIYDTPGIDTDGDGYRGAYTVHDLDTTYFRGDGVPDYIVPTSPPVPEPDAESIDSLVCLRFNGEEAETTRDLFSRAFDFEGYAIYLSTTGVEPADFALMAHRDLVNFSPHRWDFDASTWVHDEMPLTLDTLRRLYDSLCIADYGYPFSPDSFTVAEISQAFRSILPYKGNPSLLDTNYYYFTPFGANESPNDDSLFTADSLGELVTGVIRKVYPYATPIDTIYRDDGTPFRPFYEYEYQLNASELSGPLYFALVANDQGFPALDVEPLESPLPGYVTEVWPGACPVAITGDLNQSGAITLVDIVYLVNYLFRDGSEPVPCVAAADCNCDSSINLVDLIFMVNYLLKAGPEPCDVCDLIPGAWHCP